MIIRPIPPVLLPDSVQLIQYTGSVRYGDQWDTDNPIMLTHVRFDDSGGIKYPQAGAQSGVAELSEYDSRLFIDARTSCQIVDGSEQSLSVVPKKKDQIVYDGVTYQIDKISSYHTESTVHHWECDLNRV